MIFIAIAEALVIGALIWVLREQLKAAQDREQQVRMELLSVLGKTETVALTIDDRRPLREVKYVGDQDPDEKVSRYGPA